MNDTPSELVVTKEAAELLGCTIGHVNYLARTGKLVEAMKLPGETGARLFRRSDVEALAGGMAS